MVVRLEILTKEDIHLWAEIYSPGDNHGKNILIPFHTPIYLSFNEFLEEIYNGVYRVNKEYFIIYIFNELSYQIKA